MPSIHLINFSNNYGIYLIVYCLLPLLFLYKAKVIDLYEQDISFSKNTSTQLQGLFIIIIAIHHISQQMNPAGLLEYFHYFGYLAVGAFFFISGFGLMKSIKKYDTYLDSFLQKKIVQIYVPFIIINILTLIISAIYGMTFNGDQLLRDVLGIVLIDGSSWFIITILIFYLFFYISFKNNNTLKSLIIITILVLSYMMLCIYFQKGAWTFVSSLSFPLGIYYAYFEKRLNNIIRKNYIKILILSTFLFFSSFIFYILDIFKPSIVISVILFSILILIIFLKIKPNSQLFNFIGKKSLYIYLIHYKLLVIFSFFAKIDSGLWIIAYILIVIFFATLFEKFMDYFILHKLYKLQKASIN